MRRTAIAFGLLLVFATATVPLVIPAAAETFLSLPRLPADLGANGAAHIVFPSGFELLALGGPRWGAMATYGPQGTDVRGLALATRTSVAGGRWQLTGSRWGTAFYREQRAALACLLGWRAGAGVVVDTRSVAMEGAHTRRALGTGWLLHGRVHDFIIVVAGAPRARSGESRLYPDGWGGTLAGGADDPNGGRLALEAAAAGAGPMRLAVEASWRGPIWVFSGRLDLASGRLGVGVGFRGRTLSGFSLFRHDELLGVTGSFGVLDGMM